MNHRVVGLGFGRRIRRERDVTTELARERLAKRRMKSERRERRVAHAVIRARKREHAALARREHRSLQRRGDCIGAARPKKHARGWFGIERGERFTQRDFWLGWINITEREHELL